MAGTSQAADRRILFISRIGCPPPFMGNRTRTRSLLREIRALGFEVHFAGVGMSAKERAATAAHVDRWIWDFRPIPKPPGLPHRTGKGTGSRAQRLAAALLSGERSVDHHFQPDWCTEAQQLQNRFRYRRVIVSYVFLSKFLQAFSEDTVKVIDTLDAFSNRRERLAAAGIEDTWLTLTPKEEALGLARANRIIAIQSEEASFFRNLPQAPPVYEVGHFVDEEDDLPGFPEKAVVGYLASDNPLNRDALKWLLAEIWPVVRRAAPEARLVVGGGIDGFHRGEGVEFLGTVEELREFYRRISFAVNPMRCGTGLKIKTVEALSYGRCVVSTPIGAEGISPAADGILVRADPQAFAAAMLGLFSTPSETAARGIRGAAGIRQMNRYNRTELAKALADPGALQA